MGRFSTDSVAPSKRGDHWKDVINAAFLPLETELVGNAEFSGSIDQLLWRRMGISSVAADPQVVRRSRRSIRSAESASFIFICQTAGTGRVLQDQQQVDLSRGDITFVDSDRPYELRFHRRFEQAVFQVPKDLFQASCPWLTSVSPIRLEGDNAETQIIEANMRTLLQLGPSLHEALRAQAFNHLVALLSTTLGDRFDKQSMEATRPRIQHLQRAKRFILENLKEETLSPDDVSAACQISNRYLRDLFSEEGHSVTAWIKSQRLSAARMDMESQSSASESLSQIAYRWGFSDYSHFCRSFKAAYGVSPRAWLKSRRLELD